MIELHTWDTPNGRKISVALEEMGLPYRVKTVNITKDEQFDPAFLKVAPMTFADASRALGAHVIGEYRHLMQRVDPKLLDALFEPPAVPKTSPGGEDLAATISIDDFAKIDLRVARIVSAAHVDGADKLLVAISTR